MPTAMRHLRNNLAALTLLLGAMTPVRAEEFTTYKGHGGPVMALAMSERGALASASFDNSVGLWSNAQPLWLEGHDAAVTALRFADETTLLSGGDDFRVLLWRSGADSATELTRHQGKIADIAVHAQTQRIATASWDGSLKLMHRSNLDGLHHLTDHRSNVTAAGFAPDGTLYSASSDGTIRHWTQNQDSYTSRVMLSHGFGINRLLVHSDWIAYGAVDGGTRVITHAGEDIADFTLDRRPILSMAHHAPSGQMAVGDGEGYIMMIDTKAWRITHDFRAMRRGPVWALAFSTDGKTIHASGIDDVIYAWPVALLDSFDPANTEPRSFLRSADNMPNGERQFMRKCSICHALDAGPSRKAGPTLHGVFGRRAGTVPGYRYSGVLSGSDIIWTDTTINALFDQGPDHYIPGSKMPMQVIAKPTDRTDLITFLKTATKG